MILHGDSLERLKEFPDNYFDSVVTDPPYGWRFMGKAWDAPDISATLARDKTLSTDNKTTLGMAAGRYDQSANANHQFQLWTEAWAKEVFRVLKPGGHALIFCGPRTYHRMASGVEDAGFEIRDQLQWLFGSGFPKSHNIGEGRGTALKPANEPIVLARKPLSETTVAKNVLKWGTGALNIDASRIEGIPPSVPQPQFNTTDEIYNMKTGEGRNGQMSNSTQGRWPANVLFDEEAAQMLDEQSGHLVGAGNTKPSPVGKGTFGMGERLQLRKKLDNGGGASRFFYVAKASKRERNAGLEGMPQALGGSLEGGNDKRKGDKPQLSLRANHHPTVKPIRLMEYLCRLITPPSGIILDPFAGSGSTLVAAKGLGFGYVGIEMNEEYVEIARRRIGN